ncbi:MAG: SDR family oxidoreductase [Rhodobacteraceae bacterium]|nr:SDR family oxidoreductase [Paracoccaceae bacterium]
MDYGYTQDVAEGGSNQARAVFVTGATSGIGLATAELLVREGFRVFGGVEPGENSTDLRETDAEPVEIDVTVPGSLVAARKVIQDQLGRQPLWALVNSAGVVAAGPVELHNLDEARHVFDVNVMGVFATSQTFLPHIRKAKGRIVNLSSLSGLLAVPFMGPYNASKAAIESLSDTMRRELQPLGVEVIAIQPGVTRTPMWDKAEEIDLEPYNDTAYERAVETVKKTAVGKGRRGQPPERVAGAILHALTSARPPSRIRVQRNRSSNLFYSLLPLIADKIIDRKVADVVWGK